MRTEPARRSRDIPAMVMTPERIPPFIIPALAEGRRSRRYSLDPTRDRRELLQDPVTRAAMSLPHLSKITTPYGFVTLGESPRVRRKESLFFDRQWQAAAAPPQGKPAAPCPGSKSKPSGSAREKSRLQRLLAGKGKPEARGGGRLHVLDPLLRRSSGLLLSLAAA